MMRVTMNIVIAAVRRFSGEYARSQAVPQSISEVPAVILQGIPPTVFSRTGHVGFRPDGKWCLNGKNEYTESAVHISGSAGKQ